MSTADLTALIDQYRTGLEAELVLLVRLQSIATRQYETAQIADIDALLREANQRDWVTAELLAIEQLVRPAHECLMRERATTRQLPGFDQAVALQQTVAQLVTEILRTDHDAIRALDQVVSARRAAAQAAEQAEATLAAYARMSAPRPTATLVNRRG